MHLNLFKDIKGRAKARNSKIGVTSSNTSPDYVRGKLLGPNSSFAANEAYKAARTNILFTRVSDKCQIVAVTSTFSDEGKTVNCCNLAISVAQNGQRVLVIDADMRRPMVANMFGVANDLGLSEFLAGLCASSEEQGTQVIPFTPTKHQNLTVVTSGHIPPNPAELLASERMKVLLDVVSKHFDYIFIDTPPVSMVTDAVVLAKKVQGYIVVVRAGVTPIENLRNVVLKMEQLDANILGFVLNDLDAKSGSYKYKGYRSYGKYGYKNNYKKTGYSQYKVSESDVTAAQNSALK